MLALALTLNLTLTLTLLTNLIGRLAAAPKELEVGSRECYWDHVQVNGNLEESYGELKQWLEAFLGPATPEAGEPPKQPQPWGASMIDSVTGMFSPNSKGKATKAD